jgi:restriction system protein
MKMAPNSLFAILLRSPWWASLALAAGLALLAKVLLPERFAAAGMLGSFPFVIIAAVAATKQWRAPSATQTAQALQQLNTMTSRDFGDAVAAAWRADGHDVQLLKGSGADLELSKGGRLTLLAFRRWKAASVGVEPLRELHAAQLRQDAGASIYVASGALSDKAQSFAKQMNIRIVDATELALLMRSAGVLPKA